MVSATPRPQPNPKTKNVYHIGGIQVEFPYQPYGTQLAFMGRVISTLDRALKDGHCHALLESPTGTGKSLSLLCSALAWQQNYKLKYQYANRPNPEAVTDPLAYGGGFVPEVDPSGNMASGNLEAAQSAPSGATNQKKKTVPTILYSSRTHSQISQVIREYRKTSYRVPMAVLASRKHYCTNPRLRGKENVDEECKLLLKDQDVSCLEFKNVHKVKSHPSVQKGGCHEAFDIEDLVKVGQIVKGCAYYAAISMEDDAQLVFCPYSYIINPVIRGAMDVDIKGAILILDEAHNIEDTAREAGSVDIEESDLDTLQTELSSLCMVDAIIYQPLYEMTQGLIAWIEERKPTLEKPEFKRGFRHYCSCWTGAEALMELQAANVSQQCFPILLECATKAIKVATDKESEAAHLSGKSVVTLEGLFSALTYFFSRNGSHIYDYQLALQRSAKRDAVNECGNWTHTLSLWCLNPAVIFKDVAELSLSVILTSGTLSPMNTFSSELGVHFGTCLEAPHVIDVDSQVWASIISSGPGNYPLNASYRTADGYAFQDALGKTLESICSVVPGGALVFFPSYKLMDKLCERWHQTGQWSRLNARKSLFVEPRGGSQDELEPVLKGYYDSIHKGKKTTHGRKRSTKNNILSQQTASDDSQSSMKGAVFLAVCRGKVSEGIDFSDDNARVVIVVGIPFPNVNDIQVSLKKKYNDTYKSSKNLLSGSEWYCHQAFRALNQAAGRCIRHRFDYGAIILIDERYQEERNQTYISKWLRKSIRQYNDFEVSLNELKVFFGNVKGAVCNNAVNFSNISKDSAISSKDQVNMVTRKRNSKLNKREDLLSDITYEKKFKGQKGDVLESCSLGTHGKFNGKIWEPGEPGHQGRHLFSVIKDESITQIIPIAAPTPKIMEAPQTARSPNGSKQYVDLECSPLAHTSVTEGSPEYSKDVASFTMVPYSTDFQDHASRSESTNSGRDFSRTQCQIVVTPEKNIATIGSLKAEMESSLNRSVNSHTRKRRNVVRSSLINLVEEQPDGSLPDCSLMASSINSGDATYRTVFGGTSNCTGLKKPNDSSITSICSSVALHVPHAMVMDKRLPIACSLCKSPLGLPENNLQVPCLSTSSSKVHLAALMKKELKSSFANEVTSIPVLITEVSSVDQKVFHRTLVEGAMGQAIWCEEDGCVYNTIFCPYCHETGNILGVKIMAADASNVQFLNKVIFFVDKLEVKEPGASKTEDLMPLNDSSTDRAGALNLFDKFSYSPQQQTSNGWRTTKTKLRLPKRGPFSNADT